MLPPFLYATANEAPVYERIVNNRATKLVNKIQSGTYVTVRAEEGDFYKVKTAGPDGWMRKTDLGDTMGIKIFYLDVGQGDGALIEVGNLRILVDGGPSVNMYSYLTKWQYTYLLGKEQPVHIDYVFVSHFDADHYKGLIPILNDKRFTFGTVYHAGILKFAAKNNPYNTGLGDTIQHNGIEYLTKIFDNLLRTNEAAAFNRDITNFMDAVKKAAAENRLGKTKRLAAGDRAISKTIENKRFTIDVLGPFTEKISGRHRFVYWRDEGKTINGHSLVLKITFGARTFLFGGDLNTASERYLLQQYRNTNPFMVDVAKSCHHGSSDFTEAFMQQVNPFATVISSGDNESFSHPRADAVGCAGKYARGSRPLVYSTELARSVSKSKILFGMINLRCNGNNIYINQMNETNRPADMWVAYTLPSAV
jgi:beta-lactamase superfamily II metal-dependent hydrolase